MLYQLHYGDVVMNVIKQTGSTEIQISVPSKVNMIFYYLQCYFDVHLDSSEQFVSPLVPLLVIVGHRVSVVAPGTELKFNITRHYFYEV